MEIVKTDSLIDTGNSKFWKLLRAFEQIIKDSPTIEKAAPLLTALKNSVKNAADLTFRQVEAIAERCDYFMKGEYGNTKKAEHFEHQKTPAK